METYLVRVGGVARGTQTTLGTVETVERESLDWTVVTFTDGTVARKRWNQTLAVLADAEIADLLS